MTNKDKMYLIYYVYNVMCLDPGIAIEFDAPKNIKVKTLQEKQ